ncbi:amidohydrolase family protein [Candidatus Desantisbacteria bacterium]|nr:amidohydrolase family protein [Candidatus Desantisbacteria bacterium]
MHVHINNDNELFLFIAHGVTTVQNTWGYNGWKFRIMGFPYQLKMREDIKQGKILGPTIYTAGSILEGEPLTHPFMKKIMTPEAGEKEVVDQKNSGYDFIKVYDNLDSSTYNAIVKKASELKIPVKGHVPFAVGIDNTLKSGQISIDHLTGYIDPDAADFLIPENSIEKYAELTKKAGVWNCPTIVIWQKRGLDEKKIDEMANHPGMKHLSFMQKIFLRISINELNKSIKYKGDYNKRITEINYKMVNALHKAGAKLLLGTDSGNPFVFPGWSVHEELQYLVNAGLSPYESIKTATVNPAEHLGKLHEFGTIEPGKNADLVLLDKNPLNDIANISKISGVMIKGVWLSGTELKK